MIQRRDTKISDAYQHRGTKMGDAYQRRDTKISDAYQHRDTKMGDAYQHRDTKMGDAYQHRASNVNEIKRSTVSLNKNKFDPTQDGSAATYSKADNLSFLKSSLGAQQSLDPAADTNAKASIFKALSEVDREAFVTQKKTSVSSNPLFVRDSNYSKLLVVRNRSNNVLLHHTESELIDDEHHGHVASYMDSDSSHHLTGHYRTVTKSSQHNSNNIIDVLHPRFLIRTKPSVREEHLYERIDKTLQRLAHQNSKIIDGDVSVHDDSTSPEDRHSKGPGEVMMVHGNNDDDGSNGTINTQQSMRSWQNTHRVAQLGLSPRARLTLISSRPVVIGADAQEELEQILLDAAGTSISADYRRHINHVKEQSDAVFKQLINKNNSGPHRLAIRRL